MSLLLGSLGAGAGGACTDTITLDNARPRVTWVAIEAPADADVAKLTLWVADVEGDPVDVTARWSAGSESGDVALAPGSYPLDGLPTREGVNDPNGEPHTVSWDLGDVPDGAVTLTFTVDDRPFDSHDGDTYTVGPLDPRAGAEPTTASVVGAD